MDTNQAEKVRKVIDDLSSLCNCLSFDSIMSGKEMANEMTRQHPTLQQGVVRVLVHMIDNYANNTMVDDRNRGAVDWAKEVRKIDSYLPFI